MKPFQKNGGGRYLDYRRQWDADISSLTDVPVFPLDYSLQLVDSCNLHCATCHSRERTGKRLSKNILRKAISEGGENGLCSVAIGLDTEALINTDALYQTIDICNEAGIMDIMVDTNGILLTEEISEQLVERGVTMVCISIDAATADTYKKIRKSDKFDLVENNVKNLVRIRNEYGVGLPQIRISFCKTYINAAEEQTFIKKWSGIVDQIDIQNYISLVGELQDLSTGQRIETSFCKDPFRRVGILANGDVQCCCSSFGHLDIVIGNLNENTMKEIWQGERNRQIQTAFLKNTHQIPEYCKRCLSSRWEF